MKMPARTADELVGTYRTFGVEGPVHHVWRKIDGDNVRVRAVESGEERDDSAQKALNDPEAEERMFAVAFDLVVADADEPHPRGVSAAHSDTGTVLRRFDFERIQGRVDVTEKDDMANLFVALLALKALPWFPQVVRDIHGLKIENWSDFTPIIKGGAFRGPALIPRPALARWATDV